MSSSESSNAGDPNLAQSLRIQCLINEARDGAKDAMDELIRSSQAYLLLVANQELGAQLQGKLGASDVVQSALVQAQANIGQFRGQTNEELLGWMRAIVRNEITAAHRRYTTEKRNVRREVKLGESGGQARGISVPGHSPRTDAILDEEAMELRRALSELPADYRTVVILRRWEELPFDEIGRRMNRSTDAVKKLWSRAIRRLQDELTKNES